MKYIIGLALFGLLCYYGVRYHDHMNSGIIEISPPLVSLVSEWKTEMDAHHLPYAPFKRIKKIIIVDDSVVQGDAAYCSKIDQVIYIAKSTIMKGKWSTRAALWHELGHFIFELEHVNTFNIMNSYSYTESEYRDNWTELMEGYFKYCKDNESIGRY